MQVFKSNICFCVLELYIRILPMCATLIFKDRREHENCIILTPVAFITFCSLLDKQCIYVYVIYTFSVICFAYTCYVRCQTKRKLILWPILLIDTIHRICVTHDAIDIRIQLRYCVLQTSFHVVYLLLACCCCVT